MNPVPPVTRTFMTPRMRGFPAYRPRTNSSLLMISRWIWLVPS